MKKFISRTLLGNNHSHLKIHLLKGAFGSFGLRISSIILGFISSILLGRLTGADGYGIYSYALAWINLLVVVALFGTERLLVREIAIATESKNWSFAKGLLRWSNAITVGISSLIILIILLIYLASRNTVITDDLMAVIYASPLVLFLSLSAQRQATLQGFQHVVIGQLPELFFRPLIFLLLVIVHYLVMAEYTGLSAVFDSLFAGALSFLLGAFFLYLKNPYRKIHVPVQYSTKVWYKSTLIFYLTTLLIAANSQFGLIILGWLGGIEDVGIYSAASRVSSLMAFFLISVNSILAPTIATLYSTNQKDKLQKIITKSTWGVLLLSAPVGVIFIIFGDLILGMFGAEFRQGHDLLIVLVIGQLFNSAMGSVGLLLTMTKNEKLAMFCSIIGISSNTILSVLLIPTYGAMGAAIGATVSSILWNTLTAYFVHKKLNILPSIIGIKYLTR